MVHVVKSKVARKNRLGKFVRASVLLLALFLLQSTDLIGQSNNVIHQGDLIEIDELGGFEYDWRGTMNPEGFIDTLPKVADPIRARCLTTDALAEQITKEYAKQLREPRVQVRILDRSGRANVFLFGAVRQPAQFRLNRPINLAELLVHAGGLTDRSGGTISIRKDPVATCDAVSEESASRTIRIQDILAGDPSANPQVTSGDIVNVEPVLPYYVVGGVNNPGRNSWRSGLTVSRAVAAAGGVLGKGVTGKATVFRRENGASRTIEVDLKAASSGSEQDIEILANDIIEVPLSGSARNAPPPLPEDNSATQADRSRLPLRIID